MKREEGSGGSKSASGGKLHSLGYHATEEDAIKARTEGEKKYWEPLLEKKKQDVDNIDKEKHSKEAMAPAVIDEDTIRGEIYVIRGQKVMLDFDLARIYGYETKYLNRQVQRNKEKFPEDFMFRLTAEEFSTLRCQNGTTSWGGTRYLPFAYTEQGIYMLMTVLKGDLATRQSVALVRVFKSMKDYIAENRELIGSKEILQLANETHQNSEGIRSLGGRVSAIEDKMATKEDLRKVVDSFTDYPPIGHFLSSTARGWRPTRLTRGYTKRQNIPSSSSIPMSP